ncbi:MAG: hypothetical protein B6D55_04500 [Candidatus Omnitrophica bacterium 4484_70.2]|nr:MAG: hypothetical protein B6D55_04500 [Candidatus Omnitrophica bacterium 4484_70.2]
MKRILMVIAQYYPVVGGAEIQAKRISEYLVKKGFSVSVITVKKNPDLKSFEEINGVKVYRLKFLKIPKVGKYILLIYEFFFLLWKGRNFDIFHCHQGLGFSSIGVLVAKILKKPVIVKISNTGERFDLNVLKKTYLPGFIFCNFIKLADRIIYLNEKMKEELIRNGVQENKLLKISNGIDTEKFRIVSEEEKMKFKKHLGLKEKLPVFIYSGTLQKKKNLNTLIKVADILKNEGKKFKLLIVGDGPERKVLEKEVEERNLEDFISFIGKQEKIEKYLFASDIFILPSFVEGLSNALLEAGSCGLGCVVSDIPGNREVVENGVNGFLVSPSDVNCFTQRIKMLIENKELRDEFGYKIRKKIEEKFSLRKIVYSYIATYEELMSKKPDFNVQRIYN